MNTPDSEREAIIDSVLTPIAMAAAAALVRYQRLKEVNRKVGWELLSMAPVEDPISIELPKEWLDDEELKAVIIIRTYPAGESLEIRFNAD